MIFSTVMTDFLKHFFLISRGLVELITPSQSRDLKKLTQIMKVLPLLQYVRDYRRHQCLTRLRSSYIYIVLQRCMLLNG